MKNTLKLISIILAAVTMSVLFSATGYCSGRGGTLEIRVVDSKTKLPLPVRMYLKNARGKPVKPPGVPYWKGHFVFDGTIKLKLPIGTYTFEMERGPEYVVRTGNFTVERKGKGVENVDMKRFVEMKELGWWSGDLHVLRKAKDIEILMRSEDLQFAPLTTWSNRSNPWKHTPPPAEPSVRFDGERYYNLMAGKDHREGGALLYLNLKEPLPLVGSKNEYPSPLEFIDQARKQVGVHIDVEKPFWWDMPVWVASGKVDSIGICNDALWRDGMQTGKTGGKPRNKKDYPDPLGSGKWSQDIYYHLLNCGLRIPPSAGSGSGDQPNPLGYNRVYVHCGHKMTPEIWLKNLRTGRVVVTNGPLLLPRANGELPGHVFRSQSGEAVKLDLELKLFVRDPIDYIEVVKNGEVIQQVKLDQWAAANGKIPPVLFKESGWMIVRAVTSNRRTYRFASSGPYYVEIDGKQRISKKSAQFFYDWVYQRARRIDMEDDKQRKEVLHYHRKARDFWKKKVDQANAP